LENGKKNVCPSDAGSAVQGIRDQHLGIDEGRVVAWCIARGKVVREIAAPLPPRSMRGGVISGVAFRGIMKVFAAVFEHQTAQRSVRNTFKPKISAKSAHSRVRSMKQLSWLHDP
jgi:hypothetical protein